MLTNDVLTAAAMIIDGDAEETPFQQHIAHYHAARTKTKRRRAVALGQIRRETRAAHAVTCVRREIEWAPPLTSGTWHRYTSIHIDNVAAVFFDINCRKEVADLRAIILGYSGGWSIIDFIKMFDTPAKQKRSRFHAEDGRMLDDALDKGYGKYLRDAHAWVKLLSAQCPQFFPANGEMQGVEFPRGKCAEHRTFMRYMNATLQRVSFARESVVFAAIFMPVIVTNIFPYFPSGVEQLNVVMWNKFVTLLVQLRGAPFALRLLTSRQYARPMFSHPQMPAAEFKRSMDAILFGVDTDPRTLITITIEVAMRFRGVSNEYCHITSAVAYLRGRDDWPELQSTVSDLPCWCSDRSPTLLAEMGQSSYEKMAKQRG